jgi:hypothetical protein
VHELISIHGTLGVIDLELKVGHLNETSTIERGTAATQN